MRESHDDQIERWAHFMKEHPHDWKRIHTKFINAIFDKHQQIRDRLLQTPNGKEKLERLYQK